MFAPPFAGEEKLEDVREGGEFSVRWYDLVADCFVPGNLGICGCVELGDVNKLLGC